jgi:allantoin racemase
MRLLLLNGNTSQAMTDRLAAAARAIAAPDTEIVPVTARFGAEVIASRAAYAIAGHAVLDAFAAYGAGMDAVVLACFGDPGLGALKEVAGIPCFGMAEAGCRAAALRVRRFSIVTGGERWGPMLIEYARSLGFADQLASVRVLQADGGQIGANPEAAREAIYLAASKAVNQDGAMLVVLGGAGMVGQVEPLAGRLSVPVIDGLTPAIKMAEAAAGQHTNTHPGTIPATGLSPALSRLLTR